MRDPVIRICSLFERTISSFRSDLVLFDNLTSSDIVAFAPQGAERRYVGKKRAEHAFTQAEINALMIAAARKGKVVVRLKGGDPYVFGAGRRGGPGAGSGRRSVRGGSRGDVGTRSRSVRPECR